ncbi:hypothetical protein [Streptomyces althioticus]|uniref:hypothetical protein n=1 Tax=Streptomyces althioticus TaxID=83380 RepID=UPI0033D5E514
MKVESYQSAETYFVAGRSIEHARSRASEALAENPRDAWEALGYWDREDTPEEFGVFRFEVVEKVTKVDPPYTKEPK